ncbi:MAG TPA: histidinol dehydrogenase [Rectinemataceae bacterium]|nr:histidinol dehydrogenase [Rectinemataceae bacterium]
MARHPLRRLAASDLDRSREPLFDEATAARASAIVADVRAGGEAALRRWARELDGLGEGRLFFSPDDFRLALVGLDPAARSLLERTGERIRAFALAQRASLSSFEMSIPGGVAGHEVLPVASAGCYAPGGLHPLPSSVLMTALVAKAAGVESVWVASPRPAPETLAACAIAGADGLLAAGGAQAIAALAFGLAGGEGPLPPSERIVGPGNRWVAAAKSLVAGEVPIESVAGPSELLVIADGSADPELIAADLLAQAEHDPDAIPILAATDESLVAAVEEALGRQLADLPTAAVAIKALARGGALVDADLEALLAASDAFAPEHLELLVADADRLRPRMRNAGAVFVGAGAAEVIGDYGAGPNHVLPTGGSARATGGLSVFSFLRIRTWMRVDEPEKAKALYADATALARIEGLEAHARAAIARGGVA